VSLRKIAGLLVAFGLMVGLLGSGVGASFTDTATAVANINVGTFGIALTTTTGTVDSTGKIVTCTTVSIQSSAAGTAPCSFTVTSTGSINPTITITASVPASLGSDPVAAVGTLPAAFVLTAPYTFNGGLSWGTLDNSALGKSSSITYTISASA
jgi:hypothetical protein